MPRSQLEGIHGITPEATVILEKLPRRLTLPQAADVSASVHDVGGRRIATMEHGRRTAGVHDLVWNGCASNGDAQPPGVYFVVVRALGETISTRVVLVR